MQETQGLLDLIRAREDELKAELQKIDSLMKSWVADPEETNPEAWLNSPIGVQSRVDSPDEWIYQLGFARDDDQHWGLVVKVAEITSPSLYNIHPLTSAPTLVQIAAVDRLLELIDQLRALLDRPLRERLQRTEAALQKARAIVERLSGG